MEYFLMGSNKRGDGRQRGGAAVEFALIAVLLLSLIFAIIEFGILMFDKHVLTNASREGARAGVVMRIPRVSDAEIRNVVNHYAQAHMVTFGPSSSLTTNISPAEAARTGALFGTELVVSVTYPFEFLMLSNLGLDPIVLRAETRMRME